MAMISNQKKISVETEFIKKKNRTKHKFYSLKITIIKIKKSLIEFYSRFEQVEEEFIKLEVRSSCTKQQK